MVGPGSPYPSLVALTPATVQCQPGGDPGASAQPARHVAPITKIPTTPGACGTGRECNAQGHEQAMLLASALRRPGVGSPIAIIKRPRANASIFVASPGANHSGTGSASAPAFALLRGGREGWSSKGNSHTFQIDPSGRAKTSEP